MITEDTIVTHISIHAPRAGGDDPEPVEGWEARISIHAPRAGGDLSQTTLTFHDSTFQSTPPVRGATFRIVL